MSETANEPPQDEGNSFNSPRNLAMEATYINHNFSQQCLRVVSPPIPPPLQFSCSSFSSTVLLLLYSPPPPLQSSWGSVGF